MCEKVAIICEFNPLHNGHRAILEHARGMSDCVIAVMSGNFTQRSIPAVFDKYKRAEAALRAGADAVFELPVPWCSGSGEFFATGAVAIAAGLGVKSFIFGSETGNTEHVLRAAAVADSEEYRRLLEESSGDIGTAVFHDGLMEKFGVKLGSNDKLAAEYVRSAAKLGLDARFSAYKRMETDGLYKSATDLRRMLQSGEDVFSYVPREVYEGGAMTPHVKHCEYEKILFTHFRLMSGVTDAPAFDAGGGVAERLWHAAGEASCAEEFFEKAATKRYTDSRFRRAALYTVLGVTEDDVRELPLFTVLLGANEKGREFLKETKKTRGINVITKPSEFVPADGIEKRQYETWKKADELYSLCLTDGVRRGEYLRRGPHII